MKRTILILPRLICAFSFVMIGSGAAQTFTTLHSFAALHSSTNSEGAIPVAGLILSGNVLFGTAELGGAWRNGTVFRINTDGTGFTNLHSFSASSGPSYTNEDGSNPYAGLILSGNTLYGTAFRGGSHDWGTIFAVHTDGTGFTNLHNFTGDSDGAYPYASLILSNGILYGTAFEGGDGGWGTVFAVKTDGTGFTNLHSFQWDSDGEYPRGGLVLRGNTLYGTASDGGNSRWGTVFAVNTDGTGFTNLHNFDGASDGAYPYGSLVLASNSLYGTATVGGSSGEGTVFKLDTDGTGFAILHNFSLTDGGTNSDGSQPNAGLIFSGNVLYGTTQQGGARGSGTVFAVNADGSGFRTLHTFTSAGGYGGSNSDGASIVAGLTLSGSTLYGTAQVGGSFGAGTVFSIIIQPQLDISRSRTNVILTWPTNVAGFTLQSAPSLTDTFTNLPGATSPYTNPVTGAQQFFRLISN